MQNIAQNAATAAANDLLMQQNNLTLLVEAANSTTDNNMVSPASTPAQIAAAASTYARLAESAVELQQSMVNIHKLAVDQRPKNTNAQYLSKQEEWRSWCGGKWPGQPDQAIVSEQKLALFLSTEVAGRSLRRGKQSSSERTVGLSVLRAYAAAICDLYQSQHALGMNSNPHPRGLTVKVLLKSERTKETQKKKDEYQIRGAATYLDGYSSTDQLIKLSNHFLKRDSGEGLRDRLGFLLAHYGLLRGDNARRLELADLLTVDLENEGFMPCKAFLMVLDNGKTNHEGRIEYGSFIRAKEPESCGVGALAFYFFFRFMFGEEEFPESKTSFPDFSTPRNWYDLKVLRAPKSATEPINYSTHLNAMNKAFAGTGMSFKAKTHAMRGSACRMADLAGASGSNIMRAGRWGTNTSLDSCYLTTLPREVIRGLAGFPIEGGCFWLRRGIVVPSDDLLLKVFPEVESQLEMVLSRQGEQDIAAVGFLNLMKELRLVLLQDAVVMRQKHPDLFLWRHELFGMQDFLDFEKQLLASMDSKSEPAGILISKAMPHLSEQLSTRDSVMLQRLDALDASVKQEQQNTRGRILHTHNMLTDVFTGRTPLMLAANLDPKFLSPPDRTADSIDNTITVVSGLSLKDPPPLIHSSPAASTSKSSSSPTSSSFKMDRTLKTVTELWREYDEGLTGRPSVRELYEVSEDRSWRKEDSERKHYERRQVIIKWIKASAAKTGLAGATVAEQLEQVRKDRSNLLLSKLGALIKSSGIP